MAEYSGNKPLVSIIIPTFNRRRYLPVALQSALTQTYGNIEVIVVNDGGEDVSDIIRCAADNRIKFIDRKVNKGKAYSLNQALGLASGKYISYLDDDDLYYPDHIATLAGALESDPTCQVAYSDLYKVHCRIDSNGNRIVLSKTLDISRDFDRFFLLLFNHVLHVSVMHRKDLITKTGPYNENIRVLIDWDMTRRLAFFSDFIHVRRITGEYFGPVGECDRISVQMRKDVSNYMTNVMLIRASRPAKPWPKMADLSLIFLPDRYGQETAEILKRIWIFTFFPFRLILPVPADQARRINIDMPNLLQLEYPPGLDDSRRLDICLEKCDSEFTAIIKGSCEVKESWIEDSIYALMNCPEANIAMLLDSDRQDVLEAVFRTSELRNARAQFGFCDLAQSCRMAGIRIRRPAPDELPFKFDDALAYAREREAEGDYKGAAECYEHIAATANPLWMKYHAARMYLKSNAFEKAMDRINQINQVQPTVDSLVLAAKIHQQFNEFEPAIDALEQAKGILEGIH